MVTGSYGTATDNRLNYGFKRVLDIQIYLYKWQITMRTVNLRRSVVHILRRLSVRSRKDHRRGHQSLHPVNNSQQADALRTLQDHARGVNQIEAITIPSSPVQIGNPITHESVHLALESEDFERAQFILERLGDGNDRDRLMLDLCRCMTGNLISSLMDLREWSRTDSFPDEARTLYGLLLDEEGEHVEALRVLNHDYPNCDTISNNTTMKFLRVILLMRSGLVEDARRIAREFPEELPQWQRIGLIEGADHEVDEVGRLADEIIAHESVLKSLVEGLRCDPVDHHVKLLARAVRRALDHLEDRAGAFESLGLLHLLAGDHREARKWVLRGIREFPRCASLLLLLLQLPNHYPLNSNSELPHVGVASRALASDTKVPSVDSLTAEDAEDVEVEKSLHRIAIPISRGGREAA